MAADTPQDPRAGPGLKGGRAIAAFVLRVLAWGALFFTAWYLGAAPVSRVAAWGAVRIADSAASIGRVTAQSVDRGIAFHVEPSAEAVVVRRIPPNLIVDVEVNPLKYTYGLPFFLALLFASLPLGIAWKAPLGGTVVLIFASFGVACDLLVQAASAAGPDGAPLFAFAPWQREAIAIGYQLGALIFPTVVPAVLWAAMDAATVLRFSGREPAARM